MSIIGSLRFIATHPLTRDTPLQSIGRFLRWQVGSRLARGAIVYDWINGSKFLVRPGETGLTGNIYAGLHEFPEMGYLLHVLRRDDLFVDVGANAGAYTILACAAVGARGFACEPVPNAYMRLVENMRINNLEDRVTCLNVGVGSDAGQVSFTCNLDTANHIVASSEHCDNVIGVSLCRLDDVLINESPAVMKIDVEGYEMPALDGAQETLRNPTLHSIILELNGCGNRYGYDDAKISARMFDYGFRSYSYEPLDRTLTSLFEKNNLSNDTLFIRDSALVRQRLASSQPKRIFAQDI